MRFKKSYSPRMQMEKAEERESETGKSKGKPVRKDRAEVVELLSVLWGEHKVQHQKWLFISSP